MTYTAHETTDSRFIVKRDGCEIAVCASPDIARQIADAMNNEGAAQADRQAWQELCTLLDEALPHFRGVPCPVATSRLQLKEVIEQRQVLLSAVRAWGAHGFARPISDHPQAVAQRKIHALLTSAIKRTESK